MTASVVLNPYAARGAAGRRRGQLKRSLERAGIDFRLFETSEPLEAVQLAGQASKAGLLPIIAAGGDGLISEVINGLHQAAPNSVLGPLGVIPLGTANDLATNLGLPLAMEAAVEVVAAGRTRRIDLGQAGEWLFHNNSAVGLEPVVSIYNAEMTRLRGVVRYLWAALRAIFDGRSWEMELTWDGGTHRGPTTLVSVGNNPVTGGLFRMAPSADPADGRLTFVHAFAPSRRKMLALLPRTISGTYVRDPAVHEHHCQHLHIRSNPKTPLQVDGEVRSKGVEEVTYRVLPRGLELLWPSPVVNE